MKVIAPLTEDLTNAARDFRIVPAFGAFRSDIRLRRHVENINSPRRSNLRTGALGPLYVRAQGKLAERWAAQHRESHRFIDKILFNRLRLAMLWGRRTGGIRWMLNHALA